jgi:Glutathione S-transferase, N-terminal domain
VTPRPRVLFGRERFTADLDWRQIALLPGWEVVASRMTRSPITWTGWPPSARSAIVRKLKGLEDVVSLSYVDDVRDGRGWAFRERRGADPVNGFTLLAEAYEATEPGYRGHVSVPALWDRQTGKAGRPRVARLTGHIPGVEYSGRGVASCGRYKRAGYTSRPRRRMAGACW